MRVVPSRYDEPERSDLAPRELAMEHAAMKWRDVLPRVAGTPYDVLVAADTVVDVDGAAFNKPRDSAEAHRMLAELSGRTHVVHTALALGSPRIPLELQVESAAVTFFALEPEEIDAYVKSGEPFDKAGGYGIQGYGAALVERVNGDFYTVMGFPVGRFVRSLRRLGFALPITKEKTSHR